MAYKEMCQDYNVDIYSLDEEYPSGVWSRMYTIRNIDLSCESWMLSQGFKIGGEISIFTATKLYFCDLETRETKDVKFPYSFFSDRIFNYMLVWSVSEEWSWWSTCFQCHPAFWGKVCWQLFSLLIRLTKISYCNLKSCLSFLFLFCSLPIAMYSAIEPQSLCYKNYIKLKLNYQI